jgi:hypothetical protein
MWSLNVSGSSVRTSGKIIVIPLRVVSMFGVLSTRMGYGGYSSFNTNNPTMFMSIMSGEQQGWQNHES